MGIAKSVMKSGATKNSAVAAPKGMTAKAAKKVMFENTTKAVRTRCRPGLLVRNSAKPPSRCKNTRLTRTPTIERTKII